MWIRDNQPELYANTYKSLCAKDYIIMKLTGEFVTDPSDASGTNAFDLNHFKWSEEILDAANISKDKFPEVLSSTAVAGKVTKEAGLQCGLTEGTPVVVGGGDGMCASVGAGSVAPGITYNCLGSSSWICTVAEKPIFDDDMILFNWAHMVPGYVAPCGTMQAAGASFSWAIEQLFADNANGSDKYDDINNSIFASPVGANNLVFLPYLMGERSPRWNANARGAFIGLKMDTTKNDMIRAVVEGVAMNLNVILKAISKKIDIKEMTVIGGLAKSNILRKILADIYGMTITKPNFLEEGTSLGAAVAAGIGIGALSGFDDINKFIEIESKETHDPYNHAKYEEIQEIFDKAYFSLIDTFNDIAAR
jgi:xylulokinase